MNRKHLVAPLLILPAIGYASSFAGRIAFLAVLVAACWALSPTRFVTGARQHDIPVIACFVLLSAGAFTNDLVAQSAFLAIGTTLLAVTSLLAKRRGGLGVVSTFGRSSPLYVFVALFAISSLVFSPLLAAGMRLVGTPASVLAALAAIAMLWLPWRQLLRVFYERRTFLLGVSGLLVAHFVLRSVAGLRHAPADPSGAMSYAGAVCLVALPPYIWYKTFKVRESHEHLPDWPSWLIALAAALLSVALARPVVSFSEEARLVPVADSVPLLFLGMGIFVFVACFALGTFSERLRRTLMVVPFLAAVVFLGTFVYRAFVDSFILSANRIVAFAGLSSVGVPVVALEFVLVAFFLVTGYCSFLYEIWRD